MKTSLRANIRTNLTFYRRNRLLTIAGLLFFVVMMLMLIPSWFFTSSNERFQIVMQIYRSLTGFMVLMMGLIALVSVWYHRSNKCVKLVFTRPCTPEEWLASHLLSAALVFAIGLLAALGIFAALSAVWKIPFQAGVFGAALYSLVTGLLVYSYLLLLSSLMHPVLAGFLFMIFSEETFYWLAVLCKAGVDHFDARVADLALRGLQFLFEALYYILPTTSPFGEALQRMQTGFRFGTGDLKYLFGSAVYLMLFGGFCYLLSAWCLRRSRMN